MGSKNRIAKDILPIMLAERKEGQCWVEPFVGGANVIDKVDGWRIGADSNEYLIALLQHLQSNESVPPVITVDIYRDVMKNKNNYDMWFVGYVGFLFSFGAKFFGGFVGDSTSRDRIGESYRNALKTKTYITGVEFYWSSYNALQIPSNSLIYCDPPYEGTTGYKTGSFNHEEFWQWCREKKADGHTIFVSEYNAPIDFKCVWQKEVSNTIGLKKKSNSIEKLFTL